ncbi:phosphatase PAP2 family protein [Brucellaceae bacterium C25G]
MNKFAAYMSLQARFLAMVIGWGAIGFVYTLSGLRTADNAYFLTPSAIDRWFVFSPDAIWLYMSFFIFVPLGYLCAHPDKVRQLSFAMVISAIGAGIVFALFPTTMAFPPVTQSGFSAEALKILMQYDTTVNCLPSLHVTLTLLVIIAMWKRGAWLRNMFFAVWGSAIIISILQLYRHQFVDLVTGLMLGILAAGMAYVFTRFLTKESAETENESIRI